MNQKIIFKLLVFITVFFIIYILQNNFKQHKIQKTNKEIETFYTELNGRYIGDYFQIQRDLQMLFSNNELTFDQKKRLLFTQDSLRTEFGKLIQKK
ncbi:hypothetical protein [Flavobacterium sp. LC2016-01]|uniref:hypothetical protein n=1 Tax=Flavobacterium sp. LC2016-01 TaxID=2675876 RepID=UPI0012BA7A3E|nr:hypothetical protein [Flavobacterium sp. LC2016-01]MTH16503.1 hypothetical protein [Flavobacterium sp. LC2016-01]